MHKFSKNLELSQNGRRLKGNKKQDSHHGTTCTGRPPFTENVRDLG